MHAVKTEAFLTGKNLTKENTLTGNSTAVHKRSLLKCIFVIIIRRTIDLLVVITGDIRVINVLSSALRFRLMPFIGLVFNNSCRSLFVSGALEVLEQEISPHSFPTGSSKKYRKSLALGLFYKVLNNFIVLSTIFFFSKNCRPGQVCLKAIRYKLMLLLSDNIPN